MNHRIKGVLQIVSITAAFVAICFALFGRGGAAVIIGSIIDLPTLITILIARYARTNRRVVICTVLNIIAWEAIYVDNMAYNSGQFFILHVIIQGVIAWGVRTRFKKYRPVEETLQPFLTRRKKVVFGVIGLLVTGLLAVFVIDGGKRPARQQQGFSDLDRRIMNGASLGTSEDFIGGSAAREHDTQNHAEEMPFWERSGTQK